MKRSLLAIARALLLCAVAAAAQAQTYPNKPIRIVVGYAPGGAYDVTARLLGAKLQEAFGQPVVVENKPGASSLIGTDFVAKSAPDGYTLLLNGFGGMAVNAAVYPKLPYDPVKDLAPISNVMAYPFILVIQGSLPARSLPEFIAYAKANPGKLNYSSGSSGFQILTEMFKEASGTSINHIPYKGSAPSFNALVAGEVHMAFAEIGLAMPYVKNGRLTALGVSSSKRFGSVPEIPTLAEAGLPGFGFDAWAGLLAPAGTPTEIISRLNAETVRIMRSAEVRDKMKSMGFESVGSTPAEFAQTVRDDIAKFRSVAKASNMKPD